MTDTFSDLTKIKKPFAQSEIVLSDKYIDFRKMRRKRQLA